MPDVTFTVSRSLLSIQCASGIMADFFRSKLRVKHPMAFQMKKRSKWMAKWDGFVNYFDGDVGPLLSAKRGYLPRMVEAAKEEGLSYDVFDDATELKPIPYHDMVFGIELDESQKTICKVFLDNTHATVEFKTASGKSEVVSNAAACALAANRKERILIIVPRGLLLHQLHDTLMERLGEQVGKIGDNQFSCSSSTRVAVGIVNTLACGDNIVQRDAILEWLKGVTIVAIDEAHTGKSDLFRTAMKNLNPQRVWAMSGKMTYLFDKLKAMELEGIFGPPKAKGSNPDRRCEVVVVSHTFRSWMGRFEDLGLKGQITDGVPVCYRDEYGEERYGHWRGTDMETGRVPEWMLKKVGKTYKPDKTMFGVYETEDSREKVTNIEDGTLVYGTYGDIGTILFNPRNDWAVHMAALLTKRGEKWVISVRRTLHLKLLADRLSTMGLRVGRMDGKLSGEQQQKLSVHLEEGKYDGLVCNYAVASTGVNVPSLVHFIKLDAITDEQTLEQQGGRVGRASPNTGKTRGYLHLPVDSHESHMLKSSRFMCKYYRVAEFPVKEVRYEDDFDSDVLDKALQTPTEVTTRVSLDKIS